jgi:Lon protease-like protein
MSSLELPETCGAILLRDCTLFPHGGMPLRIFEPRYRQMLDETLRGSCFFAVARLIDDESNDVDPAVFTDPVGTIGLVRASREMDDGTSHLLLHGVIRVRFAAWLEDTAYPTARIQPIPAFFEPESQAEAAVEALRETAELALQPFDEEVRNAFRSMTEPIDDPAILADVISQQFVHQPEQRHDLLRMESVAERIAWLCKNLA